MKRTGITVIIAQLFVAALLSGCAAQEPKVVYVPMYLVPQDNLLQDCPVEPPPKREAFVAMTKDEKIDAISGAYNQQTINVGQCNIEKKGLRTWKEEQLKKAEKKQ